MVISGVVLLFNTSNQIIKQDHIKLHKNNLDEATIRWRKSNFVLEFAFDEGLEVELSIEPNELPENLKPKYEELKLNYDVVLLEKVFKFGLTPSYEFYCYKNNKLSKFEFQEVLK